MSKPLSGYTGPDLKDHLQPNEHPNTIIKYEQKPFSAIILAAGRGSRLKKITKHDTKCMLHIDNQRLIDIYITCLVKSGCESIIIVTGHGADSLITYVKTRYPKEIIEFVYNDLYATTNNIYSLQLGLERLFHRGGEWSSVVIMESDIWIHQATLLNFLDTGNDNAAIVSPFEYWMDGTCVEVNNKGLISAFIPKILVPKSTKYSNNIHKTVNIYRFSKSYCEHFLSSFLKTYITTLGPGSYYEDVIRIVTALPSAPFLKAWQVTTKEWHEIDDEYDLLRAEATALSQTGNHQNLVSQYGGYWKYNWITDLNLLVNPHFPPDDMFDELASVFGILTRSYPSTQECICKVAAKTLPIGSEMLAVGNGASEIMLALLRDTEEEWQILAPTFLEYARLIPKKRLRYVLDLSDIDYESNLIVVNPCNPTGVHVPKEDILRLARRLEENSKVLVYDESFADFADEPLTLSDDEYLTEHPNIIIIKSLGKSYGVPGLRLGILASGSLDLVKRVRDTLPIWNISSYAEAFLDILPRYVSHYQNSLLAIKQIRRDTIKSLLNLQVSGINIYPSQANFICISFSDRSLLDHFVTSMSTRDILIKIIEPREGLPFPCARFAITEVKSAQFVVDCLASLF